VTHPPSRARVGTEITEAWRWLLQRPQRVAAIMASWPRTVDAVTDVMREVEKVCADAGVDPADFGRTSTRTSRSTCTSAT
jgi:hypothetical protein